MQKGLIIDKSESNTKITTKISAELGQLSIAGNSAPKQDTIIITDLSNGNSAKSLVENDKLDGAICKGLPDGYVMRSLRSDDYDHGYFECLSQLTKTGQVTRQMFQERFEYLSQRTGDYNIIVIEELTTGKIVASGTILVEFKFIRECGRVGHIEDIVVHESQRGKNFGKKIIDQLTHIGKGAGCYKIILCCDEKNQGFYEKCGYVKKEVEMVHYF